MGQARSPRRPLALQFDIRRWALDVRRFPPLCDRECAQKRPYRLFLPSITFSSATEIKSDSHGGGSVRLQDVAPMGTMEVSVRCALCGSRFRNILLPRVMFPLAPDHIAGVCDTCKTPFRRSKERRPLRSRLTLAL